VSKWQPQVGQPRWSLRLAELRANAWRATAVNEVPLGLYKAFQCVRVVPRADTTSVRPPILAGRKPRQACALAVRCSLFGTPLFAWGTSFARYRQAKPAPDAHPWILPMEGLGTGAFTRPRVWSAGPVAFAILLLAWLEKKERHRPDETVYSQSLMMFSVWAVSSLALAHQPESASEPGAADELV